MILLSGIALALTLLIIVVEYAWYDAPTPFGWLVLGLALSGFLRSVSDEIMERMSE